MTQLQNSLYSDWNDQNQRGDLYTRYKIYCDCMAGAGEYIKTYDEWLNS